MQQIIVQISRELSLGRYYAVNSRLATLHRAHLSTFVSVFCRQESTQVSTARYVILSA